MKTKYASLAAATVFLSVFPGALFAQEPRPPYQTPHMPSQETPQAHQDVNTFAGKITRDAGKWVLEESASKDRFVLDDQQAAKKYKGRVVVVTGTIDLVNKTIHVEKIEAAV
jgi:hypothetical protein